MKKGLLCVVITLMLITGLFLTSCSEETQVEASSMSAKAVSDGSEDLTIDLRVNLAGTDEDNFFHWKGNVRYMAAEDSYDAVTGASSLGSTHLFMMYLYDVEAKATMSTGLRGLFLYGVNGKALLNKDNLNAMKKDDGTIVIQYVHRGTAFRFTTDNKGILSLPDGSMESRKIGDPQSIEDEFTSDGTAMGVDFEKVWSSGVSPTGASPEAMYFWDGDLMVALDNDILTVKGVLTSVEQ